MAGLYPKVTITLKTAKGKWEEVEFDGTDLAFEHSSPYGLTFTGLKLLPQNADLLKVEDGHSINFFSLAKSNAPVYLDPIKTSEQTDMFFKTLPVVSYDYQKMLATVKLTQEQVWELSKKIDQSIQVVPSTTVPVDEIYMPTDGLQLKADWNQVTQAAKVEAEKALAKENGLQEYARVSYKSEVHITRIEKANAYKFTQYVGNERHEVVLKEYHPDLYGWLEEKIPYRTNGFYQAVHKYMISCFPKPGAEITGEGLRYHEQFRKLVKHPVRKDGRKHDLSYVIISLNDEHKWTREQIADWLDTLDEQPTFYPRPLEEPKGLANTAKVVALVSPPLQGVSER